MLYNHYSELSVFVPDTDEPYRTHFSLQIKVLLFKRQRVIARGREKPNVFTVQDLTFKQAYVMTKERTVKKGSS